MISRETAEAILDKFTWAMADWVWEETTPEIIVNVLTKILNSFVVEDESVCLYCGIKKIKCYKPSEYPDGEYIWECDNSQCEPLVSEDARTLAEVEKDLFTRNTEITKRKIEEYLKEVAPMEGSAGYDGAYSILHWLDQKEGK